MRSSRARISNSPPRRARSSSTTRKSCSRMATAGRPRLPSSSPSRRPTDDKHHLSPGESRGRLFSCPGIRTISPGFRRDCGVGWITPMILQAIMFYLFAVVAVASGVMVVAARNPVHSVLFLILAFFKAAGVILLVAMIGAIVLTLRARVGVRHQSIARQLARTRAESVEVVKVPIGGGVGD